MAICHLGPSRIMAALVMGAALFAPFAGRALASPLLLSGAERTFGPSAGMGGLQVALAGGSDAAWSNPAGIAREPRSEVYLDAGSLDIGQQNVGNNGASSISASPGAVGWVSGPSRVRPRYGFALVFHFPVWQSSSLRLDDTRTINGSDLPPPVAGTVPYDTYFPGGIQRREYGTSSGNLSVVAPGFGIGFRVSDGFRVGALVRFERVSLRLQESFDQYLSAEDDSAGTNVLTGSTQSSAVYSGEANRIVALLGAQIDLGSRLVIGIVSQQPSQSAGGVGSVRINRVDTLVTSQNGTVLQQATSSIRIASDSTSFQFRSPGSLRVGVGLRFDALAMEFDLEQRQALARYEAFPALESAPPSTGAARQDALVTRSQAVTRYGIAAALALGNQASWFLGFSTDPSPAPDGDPVFRKADFYRFTTGYYATRGAFAGSLRAVYATADTPAVQFPHLGDDTSVTKPVRSAAWSIGASGSYVY